MHYLLTALIGAGIGVVAAWMTQVKSSLVFLDMAIGVLGAVPTAWFLAPLAGDVSAGRISLAETSGAATGAVFVLALWVLVRRGGK